MEANRPVVEAGPNSLPRPRAPPPRRLRSPGSSQEGYIVPIFGTRRPDRVQENLGAAK